MTTQALRDEILAFQYQAIADNIVESFKFEGFDAAHIFGLLKAKNTVAASFNMDMNLLCLIGMIRGTRSDKIAESMSAAGRNSFNGLINRYAVIATVPRNNRKNAITIGRIMSVFPHICLQHAAAGHIRDFGLTGTFALPVFARFPQFAALVPHNDEILWSNYVTWANAMNIVIKGIDNHNPDDVERFANTTNNNTMFSEEARVLTLAASGINSVASTLPVQ